MIGGKTRRWETLLVRRGLGILTFAEKSNRILSDEVLCGCHATSSQLK